MARLLRSVKKAVGGRSTGMGVRSLVLVLALAGRSTVVRSPLLPLGTVVAMILEQELRTVCRMHSKYSIMLGVIITTLPLALCMGLEP